MNNLENALTSLRGTPVSLQVARTTLPKSGGLYAWWIAGRTLPTVPANIHPTEPGLDLLYVGIAPSGPNSSRTLRSRVVGNHMNGNIAASTLRRTLAALLLEQLALTPIARRSKVVLPKEQNTLLSNWQEQHLRLTWHVSEEPWTIEASVIAALGPPLNLAANQTHVFYETLSTARRRLVSAATALQPS